MQWETAVPDPGKALRDHAQAALERQTVTEYLEHHGLRVLDQNWQGAGGQLDIVAAERRCLAVCQVKKRSPRTRSPLGSISRAKVRRLRRLAIAWLTTKGVLFDEVRIDIIGLTKDPAGGFSIEHVRGVG